MKEFLVGDWKNSNEYPFCNHKLFLALKESNVPFLTIVETDNNVSYVCRNIDLQYVLVVEIFDNIVKIIKIQHGVEQKPIKCLYDNNELVLI